MYLLKENLKTSLAPFTCILLLAYCLIVPLCLSDLPSASLLSHTPPSQPLSMSQARRRQVQVEPFELVQMPRVPNFW